MICTFNHSSIQSLISLLHFFSGAKDFLKLTCKIYPILNKRNWVEFQRNIFLFSTLYIQQLQIELQHEMEGEHNMISSTVLYRTWTYSVSNSYRLLCYTNTIWYTFDCFKIHTIQISKKNYYNLSVRILYNVILCNKRSKLIKTLHSEKLGFKTIFFFNFNFKKNQKEEIKTCRF